MPEQIIELSVVIPAYNDADGLLRLIPLFLRSRHVVQLIIVDDASSEPLNSNHLFRTSDFSDPRVEWIQCHNRRGAGRARNIGLNAVTSEFVLFFDADDAVLPEFEELADELAIGYTRNFDFCMFRHADSRERGKGNYGPLKSDQFHWDMINSNNIVTKLSDKQKSRICRVSAYPWNKIYRTKFLKDNKIRCTEIPVHNDIELHWRSFFHAEKILISNRICCEHHVSPEGQRLTNWTGRERFSVFHALRAVHIDLQSEPRFLELFSDAVLEFYLNLFNWILNIVDEQLRHDFRMAANAFIKRYGTRSFTTIAALNDPIQLDRLNKFITDSPQ